MPPILLGLSNHSYSYSYLKRALNDIFVFIYILIPSFPVRSFNIFKNVIEIPTGDEI